MEAPTKPLLDRPDRRVRWIIVLNLVLGVLLWIALCSDLELASTLANVLLPPIIGLIGVVSLRALWRHFRTRSSRRERLIPLLSCVPAIIGGIPYVLLALVAIIPPIVFAVILGGMFALSENVNRSIIQEAQSPDGWKTAEVWFYPVGAYSGGNGRIEVDLRYHYMPFVRREVYYLSDSYRADNSPQEYVSWLDDDTLRLLEEARPLAVGRVKWHLSWMVTLPIAFVSLLPRVLPELLREYAPYLLPQ